MEVRTDARWVGLLVLGASFTVALGLLWVFAQVVVALVSVA